MDPQAPLPALSIVTYRATSASNDQMLVDSWVAGMGSPHTRRNVRRAADRFLTCLHPAGYWLAQHRRSGP